MEPVIIKCLFEYCSFFINSIPLFIEKCIKGIKANEERVHAGEFLRLIKELDPDEEKFYSEGAEEVEEEIENLKDK